MTDEELLALGLGQMKIPTETPVFPSEVPPPNSPSDEELISKGLVQSPVPSVETNEMPWKNDIKEIESVARAKEIVGVEPVSPVDAGVRGAGQGISLGFLDEISAATQALSEAVISGNLDQIKHRYNTLRDYQRELNRRAQQQQPGAYIAGEVAGATAVPGGLALKGAKTVGQVAARGAGVGGAMGLGASKAELTEGEIEEAALDTLTGAAAGAAGGALVKKAADLVGKIGNSLMVRLNDDIRRLNFPNDVQLFFRGVAGEYSKLKDKDKELKSYNEAINIFDRYIKSTENPAIRKTIEATKNKFIRLYGAKKAIYTRKNILTELNKLKDDNMRSNAIKTFEGMTTKDLNFVINPFKYLQDIPVTDAVRAIMPMKIAINILKTPKKAYNAISDMLLNNEKKYGMRALYKMGTVMNTLSTNPGMSRYAEGIQRAINAFGVAGAGVLHVNMLKTDPEYRKIVAKELKEFNLSPLMNNK